MRSLAMLLALVLAAACSRDPSPEVTPEPAPSQTVVTPSPERHWSPRRGLSLRAELAEPGPFEVGAYRLAWKARITNNTDARVPVVQLSDGSSQKWWREPYVFYTVERFTQEGEWKSVPAPDMGRCGNHDEDWSDEVQTIEPGKHVELKMTWAPWRFGLQEPGPYRVRVHYRFQGDHPKQSPAVASTGMAGEDAYELVSAPVTFQMVKPIEVRLDAVKTIKVNEPVLVQDVLRLEVQNVSGKARRVELAAGGNTSFEMVGEASSPSLSFFKGGDPPTYEVAADGRLLVMGPDSKMATPVSPWTVTKAGTYLLRVHYQGVSSNWTKVTVE